MKNKNLNIFIVSLVLIFCFSECKKTEYKRTEGFIWNTLYHITYKSSTDLSDSISAVLDKVGKSLSVFDKSSLVSEINEKDSTFVDEDFIKVYSMSEKIYELSGGLFDPTVSPLITAWGFGLGHATNNDTLSIDSVLQFVGLKRTHLKDRILIKDDKRIQFNFSAIAKGYGCDAIGEMFQRNGVKDFMVEIGGEIMLGGVSPSGSGWKISIDSPQEEEGIPTHDSYMIIKTSDCGIATSGNYRNFRKEGGKTYAHTISPLTGRPIENNILSATVVAPSCMEADAVATACMAAGLDSSIKMINDSGLNAMLITTDSLWCSPGFKDLIEGVSEPGNIIRN